MTMFRLFIAPALLVALSAATAFSPTSPRGISGPRWQSHPAIDPLTGDVWFVDSDQKFAGWRLLIARCRDGQLAGEQASPISAPGLEADPFFTSDGKRFYFISSRLSGGMHGADLDIWMMERPAKKGWSKPVRLPEPVSSSGAEWFPRTANDGWLYFGSSREGGRGGNDIWRARRVKGHWQVENLGAGVNSSDNEYEFAPAADGRTAVLGTDKGVYRLQRVGNSWGNKKLMDKKVNVNGTEVGATFADPHGSTILVSRDVGKGLSGEIVLVTKAGTSSALGTLTSTCRALRRR